MEYGLRWLNAAVSLLNSFFWPLGLKIRAISATRLQSFSETQKRVSDVNHSSIVMILISAVASLADFQRDRYQDYSVYPNLIKWIYMTNTRLSAWPMEILSLLNHNCYHLVCPSAPILDVRYKIINSNIPETCNLFANSFFTLVSLD